MTAVHTLTRATLTHAVQLSWGECVYTNITYVYRKDWTNLALSHLAKGKSLSEDSG